MLAWLRETPEESRSRAEGEAKVGGGPGWVRGEQHRSSGSCRLLERLGSSRRPAFAGSMLPSSAAGEKRS